MLHCFRVGVRIVFTPHFYIIIKMMLCIKVLKTIINWNLPLDIVGLAQHTQLVWLAKQRVQVLIGTQKSTKR